MTEHVLGGIVLAAGASRRMGTPKAFLEIGGETFLTRAVGLLSSAGCAEVVVVCPPGESKGFTIVAGPLAHIIENPQPERGMLSSLGIGFDVLRERVTHAMVTLVDTPLIAPQSARMVAEAMVRAPDRVIVPCFRGEPGHPVIYPRAHWAAVVGWEGEHGARGFLASRAGLVHPVSVEDPAIGRDFDTPAELRAWREREGFVNEE